MMTRVASTRDEISEELIKAKLAGSRVANLGEGESAQVREKAAAQKVPSLHSTWLCTSASIVLLLATCQSAALCDLLEKSRSLFFFCFVAE
jgi:hypothetical protein